MADKNYKLKFMLTDGKTQEVEFTAPQGPKGDQGESGKDYSLTPEDKKEIAEMAAGLVEVPDSGGNVDLTGAKVGETILVNSVDENGKPTEWKSADMVVQNIEDATKFLEKTVMTGFYFYLSAPLPNGYYYYDANKYGSKLLYMVVINAEGTAVDRQFNLGRPKLFHISSNESEIVITEVDATENSVEYVYDIANKTYESYVVRYCSRKIDELLEGRMLSPESATVGQVVVVKSVDENGKPIEWETRDFPDSGGNVAYDEAQNLTDEQKAQARENIGAQPAGNYLTEVPEGYAKTTDIPTDDHIKGLINTALGVIENGTY